jgi:hypothetical protein
MAAHEAPAAVHARIAADYLHRRAAELIDEAKLLPWNPNEDAIWRWAGHVVHLLGELVKDE